MVTMTREQKDDIGNEPHACVLIETVNRYGHVRLAVFLNSDSKYEREGKLILNSQIGTDHLFSVTEAIKNPARRSYAHRVTYESSPTADGVNSKTLTKIAKIMKKFEEDETRDGNLIRDMFALLRAAKIRYVFLQPQPNFGYGNAYFDKLDAKVIDLRQTVDLLEMAQHVELCIDSIWKKVIAPELREQAHNELEKPREVEA